MSFVAIALTSQVSAQQQGYPPAGYQPYPQVQPVPPQPVPQQVPPQGYYPQQEAPVAPGGYGYPQQGYAPNPAYPGYVPPAPPLVSSVSGAFQIGAGISLLSFDSTGLTATGSTAPGVAPGMVPMEQPITLITTCCAVKNPFFIEAAYGLSDQLLLGAKLQFVSTSEATKDPVQNLSMFGFSFGPKLDYQLLPTSRWNPFIGAVVDVTLSNKSLYRTKDSRTVFGVRARGGLRCFVLDQLSIDPLLELGGHFGSGTQTPLEVTSIKQDYSLSGFEFAISMGISLWVK